MHLLGPLRALHEAVRVPSVGRDGHEQSLSLPRVLAQWRTPRSDDAQAARIGRVDSDERAEREARSILGEEEERGLLRRVFAGCAASVSRVQLHAGSSGEGAFGETLFGVSAYARLSRS